MLASGLVVGFAAWSGGGRLAPADGLLLASVFSAAIGYVAGARLVEEMPAERAICWVLVTSLPLTVPATLLVWPEHAASAAAWGGFAYVTVFSMWLGFFAWYRGLALGGTDARQPGAGGPALSRDVLRRADPRRAARCGDAGFRGGRRRGGRRRPQDVGRRRRPPCLASIRRRACGGFNFLEESVMNRLPSTGPWRLATRAERMSPSAIRELLKLTERPGIISLAGGLPAADLFPVEAMREATERVLRDAPSEALQYAGSEGFAPLREWVAADLERQGLAASADQVVITAGSQQGLDLVGKVLIDAGSRVAVESPTYLGALQAFAVYEPEFVTVENDDEGPLPDSLGAARGARFFYVLPNFQNPSGRRIGVERRAEMARAAQSAGVPIVEDNPYGDLWYDAPPPAPIASHWPEGTVYLGSFSKVLVPGLRLGYVVAPPALFAKLVEAKQAADLSTPGFNQRIVHEVVKSGFLDSHVPTIRARYRRQRDAMQAALAAHLPTSGPLACRWRTPGGGMFFWIELPAGVDSDALLARAIERGVAFVPGKSFFADGSGANTMRLSFVTVSAEAIERGIAALAAALARAAGRGRGTRPRARRVMTRFAFSQVDVFTDTALRGNPLAVVHDADALDESRMQAFARWTNLSETSFLLAPTDPGADYRVRIFTPGGELPFAGHPTLGSCHAWLERGGVSRHAGEVVQQCGVGLVRLRREDGRAAFAAPRSFAKRCPTPTSPRRSPR